MPAILDYRVYQLSAAELKLASLSSRAGRIGWASAPPSRGPTGSPIFKRFYVKSNTWGLIISVVALSLVLVRSVLLLGARHPVVVAGLLCSRALATSAFLGGVKCSWLIFLLALVFLGGVIVVILFVVAVCGNEKLFFRFESSTLKVLCLRGVGLRAAARLGISRSFSRAQISNSLYQLDVARGYLVFMLVLVLGLIVRVGVCKLESGPLVKRL